MDRVRIEAFATAARKLLKQQIGARISLLMKSESSAVVIENKGAMTALENQIEEKGTETVIDEVAYTWFNRLCALRYMDVHGFNRPMIVTPQEGNVLPEILSDVMTGNPDSEVVSKANEERINRLLSGDIKSGNAQAEIYRILLVSKCNALNKELPMLFERISDYTDLLLPEDLLSRDAIIPLMKDALTDENCETVEVIGWLYQYYIAERKDEVFAGFRKGKKATAREIPAATQLFTPDWIVRYLAENSIGRLWMLNHPESGLAEKMEYYIEPVDAEPDFIRINTPEEIRICDPCCGSGHMLTYAFDLLFEIYSELGYTSKDAVEHILRDNLYGIEIDDRAGQLAYFALMMKAREKYRRFFSLGVEPNICVLHNITFDDEELRIACGLFSNTRDAEVRKLLTQFEHADTFGSLIIPCIDDIGKLRNNLTKTTWTGDLFDETDTIEPRVHEVLKYADYLSSKYQVVITNPPYMGNYDDITKAFVTKNYPDSKSDLCTAFMERNWKLSVPHGYSAMVNMQSWMFLSSYEKLRKKLLQERTILSMAHIGARGFDSIGGEVVSTTAFVCINYFADEYQCSFARLTEGAGEIEKSNTFKKKTKMFYSDSSLFVSIPSSPIVYWLPEKMVKAYINPETILLRQLATPKAGLATGDNNRFMRLWYEVSFSNIGFGIKDTIQTKDCSFKWFPCNSGGIQRKWACTNEYIVNWEKDGQEIKSFRNTEGKLAARPQNTNKYFKPGLTWNKLCSNNFSARYKDSGFIFDDTSRSAFPDDNKLLWYYIGMLNSIVALEYLRALNPTMSFTNGDIERVPVILSLCKKDMISDLVMSNIHLSTADASISETSWDFVRHPLAVSVREREEQLGAGMYSEARSQAVSLISERYERWKKECNDRFCQLKTNEEELNRIFIDIYGLQDELVPEEDDSMVSVHRIFDTPEEIPASMKNGSYALTKKDVIKSFVSYAVGCMFGRYSLDSDGLAFAGGNWDSSLYGSFMPDDDNVIPVLSDEWFADDITFRFREFVKVCFGDDALSANMRFIEDALGMSVRNYFIKEFYKDHLKVYQKRPIYWMFSSPKGYFNALVYLHRYNSNTSSAVLGYLRRLRDKLSTEIGALERENNTRNAKKLVNFRKVAEDLDDYERILYPIAMENISLDLDDGVKVNYAKLGKALKKVPGLEKSE